MYRMSEPIATVLYSCGCFNPITNMHLRLFELAKDYLNRNTNYSVIKGIISPASDLYETTKKLEASEHRCEMVRRSLIPLNGREHWVQLDVWECTQNVWLRTAQVLDHHYRQLNDNAGKKSNIALKLLCGADLLETFNVPNLWKDEDIEKIVGEYGLVVISREGYDPWKTINNSDKSPILLKHKQNIHVVEEKIANLISSTAIRNAIKNGESIRYLIPDPVIEYIENYKLYK